MLAEDIPLQRHSDICCGTPAYTYIHSLHPTQEAFWYLPWDSCLYIRSFTASHSRGILIFAVGPLPIRTFIHCFPLKRHSDICCGTAAHTYLHSLHPTQEAFWYLPWDSYLYARPFTASHSRGILIFAMGPLLICTFIHCIPLKRHSDIFHGTATLYSLTHSSPHSRSNAVSCVEALSFSLL